MVERGLVKEIDKKSKLVVEFDRKASCEKCGMCAFGKDNMKVSVKVDNTLNAKVGDIVEVKMGDKFVLASAAVVYIIPLILVALALILSRNLDELVQFALVMVSLVIGFTIAAFIDKKAKNNKGFVPTLVQIVEPIPSDDERNLSEGAPITKNDIIMQSLEIEESTEMMNEGKNDENN